MPGNSWMWCATLAPMILHGHTHVAGLGGLRNAGHRRAGPLRRSGLGTGSLPPTISIESVAWSGIGRSVKFAASGDQAVRPPVG